MSNSGDLKEAINTFVLSLEEEQKKTVIKNIDLKKKEAPAIDEDGFKKIVEISKNIIELICFKQEIKLIPDLKKNKIIVEGNDLSVLIGKNGKNIEALDYIINLIAKRKKLAARKIIIDVKDYRKKNIEEINKLALRMAEKVKKEGKKIILRPMSSYERKIVHNLLSKVKEVKTKSKDNEPNRRIVIYPAINNN